MFWSISTGPFVKYQIPVMEGFPSNLVSFMIAWLLQEISLYSGQIQDSVSKALNLKQPTVQSPVFRPALDATLAALLMQLPLQAAQQLSGAEEVDENKDRGMFHLLH